MSLSFLPPQKCSSAAQKAVDGGDPVLSKSKVVGTADQADQITISRGCDLPIIILATSGYNDQFCAYVVSAVRYEAPHVTLSILTMSGFPTVWSLPAVTWRRLRRDGQVSWTQPVSPRAWHLEVVE